MYFTIIFSYIRGVEWGSVYQTQDEGEEVENLTS